MVDIDEKGQELVLRRIFATVLIVLGLAIAGAGIASGTIWRADEQVTATLPQDPDAPVVVAGGNVLATVNPNVTVTVSAPDADTPLVLAMGREADVRAWLGESPYEEVTGLTDWETLAVESSTDATDATEDPSASEDSSGSGEPSEDPSGSGEPSEDATDEGDAPAEATVPDPAGSDLWIEEVTDTGELTYEWSQVDGRWMMLVASDGSQPAPTVSMTWTREVTTPLMVPGMIIGGVIFLIGLVWLAGALAAESGTVRGQWIQEPLPLTAVGTEVPDLPEMDQVTTAVADVWATGVSTDSFPTQFRRDDLDAGGVLRTAEVPGAGSGTRVRVAGVVTHRQRPATASGVTFLSLEDETGLLNVICSAGLWQRYRQVVRGSAALVVRGTVEHADGVTNLMADQVSELSLRVASRSRDFR